MLDDFGMSFVYLDKRIITCCNFTINCVYEVFELMFGDFFPSNMCFSIARFSLFTKIWRILFEQNRHRIVSKEFFEYGIHAVQGSKIFRQLVSRWVYHQEASRLCTPNLLDLKFLLHRLSHLFWYIFLG